MSLIIYSIAESIPLKYQYHTKLNFPSRFFFCFSVSPQLHIQFFKKNSCKKETTVPVTYSYDPRSILLKGLLNSAVNLQQVQISYCAGGHHFPEEYFPHNGQFRHSNTQLQALWELTTSNLHILLNVIIKTLHYIAFFCPWATSARQKT